MANVKVKINKKAISNQLLKAGGLDSLLKSKYQSLNKKTDTANVRIGRFRKVIGYSVSKKPTEADYKKWMQSGSPKQKMAAKRYFANKKG